MTSSTIGGGPKPPRHRGPQRHTLLTNSGQVWCWDITWLPGPIRGQFYFLYLIIDLYSRKIVGWEVHEVESSVHARELVQRTVWREGILDQPLVLHGDNGSPLKGATVQALLSRLGITASFSRPRVSDDNAYAEALFRTLKYSPGFPRHGFAALETARDWVHAFADWYNTVHRHRGIKYVTPHRGTAARMWESCVGAMSCMMSHGADIRPGGPVTRATGVTFERSG